MSIRFKTLNSWNLFCKSYSQNKLKLNNNSHALKKIPWNSKIIKGPFPSIIKKETLVSLTTKVKINFWLIIQIKCSQT
jgi:hypothetical protein